MAVLAACFAKIKTFARADSGRKSASFERLSAGRTRPEAEFVATY
jgi:hypothetical protein